MKKFDIVTLGSITLDTFIEPSELNLHETPDGRRHMDFEVGQKIQMKTVARHVGGGSANTAVGFARLGLKTAALGTLGDDDHGDFILHQLQKMNVETSALIIKKRTPSSSSLIFLTPDGQRTIFNEQAAHTSFRRLPRTRSVYLGHVHQEEVNIFNRLVKWKRKSEKRFFTKTKFIGWTPGKTQFEKGFDHFKGFFPSVDLLILNREEAELFTKCKTRLVRPKSLGTQQLWRITPGFRKNFGTIADMRKIAQKFLDAGVKAVVVTDGKRGAQYISERKYLWAPILTDKPPVSSLGSGDAFSVGYVGAALLGKPVYEQMYWGGKNSDSVLRVFGAQEGQMNRKQLEKEKIVLCVGN